ncbi:MAG: D-2-hydroxyacid dehydrogenase [Gemmatimonadota bacterium]|nr:MAG: D-2-hydroxyacid dehydrogenase [Gemmatimonadota bacterium]
MRRAVVSLTSLRPIWSIPATHVSLIREAFGAGWDVVQVSTPISSDGDGAVRCTVAEQAARGAEVYIGWGVPTGVIEAAGKALRWVHTAAAGVGGSITAELRSSGALLTNSRGVHAEPIAEWVLTAIGLCARGFLGTVAAQAEHRWAKTELASLDTPIRELSDLRVGLIGLGGIGRAVARRCSAVGMHVSAVRHTRSRRRPKGVRWVGGPGDLLEMVQRSDVLVIAAPHTSETRSLVDEQVLAALPVGAYVLNVARGALLDEEALLVHLDRGHLGGCVLDVFATEPLPADHPFWDHPKVLVSPHVSGVSSHFWEREVELITENISRYLRGMPMKNVVNLTAGY